MKKIADIRKEYMLHSFSEAVADPDPIRQFTAWWEEALRSQVEEVNACTLATATAAGIPSARVVLLKGYDENGFVFFTNYESNKGRCLAENPRACMVFFWKELERQVKIEGTVKQLTAAENDEYYFSRPVGSQIGAWASPQSRVIAGREVIEENVRAIEEKLASQPLTRPPHWGGYRVHPHLIEFWQGRPSRLHDRLQYSLIADNSWIMERLAP